MGNDKLKTHKEWERDGDGERQTERHTHRKLHHRIYLLQIWIWILMPNKNNNFLYEDSAQGRATILHSDCQVCCCCCSHSCCCWCCCCWSCANKWFGLGKTFHCRVAVAAPGVSMFEVMTHPHCHCALSQCNIHAVHIRTHTRTHSRWQVGKVRKCATWNVPPTAKVECQEQR